MKSKKYIIVLRNIFKRYYWNIQYGWVDRKGGTRFTEEQKNNYFLPPLGGQWTRIN